ncbi:MAG: PQQ-binding-like beta-propeller repeat protein [Acidimicrobiales bacterium]
MAPQATGASVLQRRPVSPARRPHRWSSARVDGWWSCSWRSCRPVAATTLRWPPASRPRQGSRWYLRAGRVGPRAALAERRARRSPPGSTALLGPSSGRIRWERRLEGPVTPGPAGGADGTLYAPSHGGGLPARHPPTGADRWTFDGGGSYGSDLSTSPAVLDDGTVVWPGPGGVLHGIDDTGRPLWQHPMAGFALSPAMLADGSVAIADMTGTVAVLEWVGLDHRQPPRNRWSVDLGQVSYASPAVGADGTVYGAADSDLVALDPATGVARWRFATGDTIEVSPSVAPDGTVVIASNDPFTYGVAPDGTQRWRHRRGALLLVAVDHRYRAGLRRRPPRRRRHPRRRQRSGAGSPPGPGAHRRHPLGGCVDRSGSGRRPSQLLRHPQRSRVRLRPRWDNAVRPLGGCDRRQLPGPDR